MIKPVTLTGAGAGAGAVWPLRSGHIATVGGYPDPAKQAI